MFLYFVLSGIFSIIFKLKTMLCFEIQVYFNVPSSSYLHISNIMLNLSRCSYISKTINTLLKSLAKVRVIRTCLTSEKPDIQLAVIIGVASKAKRFFFKFIYLFILRFLTKINVILFFIVTFILVMVFAFFFFCYLFGTWERI